MVFAGSYTRWAAAGMHEKELARKEKRQRRSARERFLAVCGGDDDSALQLTARERWDRLFDSGPGQGIEG